MNLIAKCTKDCPRKDCSLTVSAGIATCIAWTPVYDRAGKRVDDGDPNIIRFGVSCSACGDSWSVKEQRGKTEIARCPSLLAASASPAPPPDAPVAPTEEG